MIEKAPNLQYQHQVQLLPRNRDVQRIQRFMLAAPWPEAIREATKILLVNLIEDGNHCLLNDLVLQGGDPERPLSAVWLRYVDSSRWLRSISAAVNPAVQIDKSILQSGFILLPCDAIYSWGSFPLQGVKAIPEQPDRHMVEQSRELHLLTVPCCVAHTRQPLGHACLALSRVRAGLMSVLLDQRPSLPTLRRRFPAFFRMIHPYCSAVRLLADMHAGRTALAFTRRPVAQLRFKRLRGPPALVPGVSRRAC